MNIRYPIYEGVYRILTFQQAKPFVSTSKNQRGSLHKASQITCFFDSKHQIFHRKTLE